MRTGESPSPVVLRRATAEDQETIRRMVREAWLDRSELHWSHFVVAEREGSGIVGIGQVRPYPGCPELGSLVVRKPFRAQGIAGRIIGELLALHAPPVYLECRSTMAPYYARFGFEEIPWQDAPMPLRRKARLANRIGKLFGFRLAVMRYQPGDGRSASHDRSED